MSEQPTSGEQQDSQHAKQLANARERLEAIRKFLKDDKASIDTAIKFLNEKKIKNYESYIKNLQLLKNEEEKIATRDIKKDDSLHPVQKPSDTTPVVEKTSDPFAINGVSYEGPMVFSQATPEFKAVLGLVESLRRKLRKEPLNVRIESVALEDIQEDGTDQYERLRNVPVAVFNVNGETYTLAISIINAAIKRQAEYEKEERQRHQKRIEEREQREKLPVTFDREYKPGEEVSQLMSEVINSCSRPAYGKESPVWKYIRTRFVPSLNDRSVKDELIVLQGLNKDGSVNGEEIALLKTILLNRLKEGPRVQTKIQPTGKSRFAQKLDTANPTGTPPEAKQTTPTKVEKPKDPTALTDEERVAMDDFLLKAFNLPKPTPKSKE